MRNFLVVVEILQAVNEQTGLLWLGDELFSFSQSKVQAKSTVHLILLLIFHYYIQHSLSLVIFCLVSRGVLAPAVAAPVIIRRDKEMKIIVTGSMWPFLLSLH